MSTEITLIYPDLVPVKGQSYGINYWINHGLASISAYAKSRGHIVRGLDLRLLKDLGDFSQRIEHDRQITRSPKVFGVYMGSWNYDIACQCLRIIKKLQPAAVTVVGGPHASIMPQEVEHLPEVDYVVIGEGELAFTQLVESIERNEPVARVIIGEHPVLDSLPFVDRALFDYRRELRSPPLGFKSPFVTIISGRGCIYNCSFCAPAEQKIFGKKVRQRSPENLIEEIRYLDKRYQFKTLMIHDDCFTQFPDYVEAFCELYRYIRKPFICQSRTDIICRHPDMIRHMRDVGLQMFLIGFESGNQRILRVLRKGTTVEQNYEAAEICHRLKIKIWANYMLGNPTETKEEALDTIKMIKRIRPHIRADLCFTPYPGTDLFKYCVKNGLILFKGHSSFRRNLIEPKIKGVDYDFLLKQLRAMNKARRLANRFISLLPTGMQEPVRSLYFRLRQYMPLPFLIL